MSDFIKNLKARVYIIAEAGVNHNGSLETALKMIDVAAEAGVDAIKFQTFKAENIASKSAPKAEYQIANGNMNESQYEMLKRLELSEKHHQELLKYCRKKGIQFLSSPFDLSSVDLLEALEIPCFKIPSGEITNYPLLKKIAETRKPTVISTGMATLEEVKDALAVFEESGVERDLLVLLQCNTEYPTPLEDVNLKAMITLKSTFHGIHVGYSDHTNGILISVASVAMGARIVEKHFTLDKQMEGPDHKASLEPLELKEMVKTIRAVETALGNGVKEPSKSELKNKIIARKSIVAACSIKKGEVLNTDNITVKRPGSGISPMNWLDVIGTKAIHDYSLDDLIEV